MSESKMFSLGAIISTITGMLVCEIGDVYAVSEFMTGGPVWTHQLPRVGREICPEVLRQHPHLEPVVAESEAVNHDNWQDLLAGWVERFGAELPLTPMPDPVRVEPLGELIEMTGADRVVTVLAE